MPRARDLNSLRRAEEARLHASHSSFSSHERDRTWATAEAGKTGESHLPVYCPPDIGLRYPAGGQGDSLVVDASNHATWSSLVCGRHVQIEVSDTGTGIPPELLERIFEPFFTTKPIDQGTGLGLSSSLGILQSHAGTIQVDSEVGHGTRLRILLPAKDSAARVESANPLEIFEGKGRTVLVIEDEENIRLILQTTLRRLSMEVLSAANGDDGLAMYRTCRDKIDLVISDLHMPGMDGLELLRTIRADSPGTALVVMSGRIDERTHDEINTLNINYILKRPFGHSEIVQALRYLFGPG